MKKIVTLFSIYFFVVLLCTNMVNAPINLSNEETNYENKLNNVLIDITNSFAFGQNIHIVMSEDNSPNWFWSDLLKKHLFEKWSIVITNPNKQVNGITLELPDVYIIFFNNYQNLIQLCNVLRNVSMSWNPEAKFLLITAVTNKSVSYPTPAANELALNIFNDLWSRNVVRVSLVIFNKPAKTASLFSSEPYSKFYKTCKKILNFSQLQEINLLSNVTPLVQIAGYQFEPPNSFMGCPLIGHTFPFPPYSIADTSSSSGCRVYNSGIEVQLLNLFGNLNNFSLEILTTPHYGSGNEWLFEYSNGSRRGMLEDILQNKIDLAFAGVIPPSIFYFCLGLTNTYIFSSMSWYVPGAEIIPIWKLVLNTFSGVTWLFMLSLLFLVTTLYYLISSFEMNKVVEPVDLTMVALSLGLSVQWTKRPRVRIILLAWSLFCFHVALMFNTRLFSVLTEPPLDSEIETIEQLYDSKFKSCTYSSYKKFYTNRTDGVMRYLIENAHICDSLDESVLVLLKYKNLSILAKDDYMAFKIDNKIENVHQLKDHKFISYPVVMPVAKGSVFLRIFNRLVFNVTESGLVFKWLSDVRRTLKNKFLSKGTQEHNTGNNLMTREDFIWLYYVFLSGQVFAFIVFLIEVYVKSVS